MSTPQETLHLLGRILSGEGNGDLTALLSGRSRVYNPGVDRTGDKIIVPEGANLSDVIKALQLQNEREQQQVKVRVTLPVSPWDGAVALVKALERELGVVIHQGCDRGCCPPTQIDVEVDFGKTISVPWGNFSLPNMENASISTGTAEEDGRMIFECVAICKRRYEARLRRLIDTVKELATKESLHRGKAFSIVFRGSDGDEIEMPKPKFFELTPEEPIFRSDLTAAIERNVFVPIRYADELVKMGESLKRGIAFVGDYGVGKTLLASHVARVATAAGWTFIYVKEPTELPEALRFAQQYQPVVVFAEDVDRIAGPERTDKVNELLNQLDGIDGKASRIMTILTSNHPDRINPAMRRPGRIDLVLEVQPPDAETVGRMINTFTGNMLEPDVDLSEVQKFLEGQSPARVRETVGRAKLEVLRRTGRLEVKVSGADLAAVAREVKQEASLFQRHNAPTHAEEVTAMANGLDRMASAMRQSVNGNGRLQ